MNDCPNCEYHRQRAQLWREEAYKQAGHPLPEREWVGLTDEEIDPDAEQSDNYAAFHGGVRFAEAKLKEKNNG